MRAIIAMCTMIVSLGLAGLAASSHGDSVPYALEPGCRWRPSMAVMHA